MKIIVAIKSLLILLCTTLYSQDFNGEILHYSAGFRFLTAGSATLSIKLDSLNNESVYLLTSSIRTNSFLSKFYKVHDEIKSWINIDSLNLIKTIQNINEGNYHIKHEAIIKNDSIIISNNNEKQISSKIYDPIAFVYFLRKQKLTKGNKYHFISYGRKNLKKVIIDIKENEKIEVPFGIFNCKKIEPVTGDGKPLLKNNGIMKVWLSDDSLKLPIMIEQNTNVGTMVMKLKNVSYPINK